MSEELQSLMKPKRVNGRRPGSKPPGCEYLGAPWIAGAEPRSWTPDELRQQLAPLNLKQRVYDACMIVLCRRLSYKEAADSLGETSSYVRNAVVSTADRLGGKTWMYAPKALRAVVIENVPLELHAELRELAAQLIERHRRKVVDIKGAKK